MARVSFVIRTVAITVIVFAGLVIAAAIVFPLPEIPRMRGLAAFRIVSWIEQIAPLGVLVAIVVTAVRLLARRNATAWLAVFLPMLVSVMTTILYLPFLGTIDRRIDRIAGPVDEPVPAGRALAIMIAATLALALVLIVMTRGRQRAALAVPMILCTILIDIYSVFVIMPMRSAWFPAEWQRRDLLVPFRPCRGAGLWTDVEYPHMEARVDDIWLQFADPRKGGALVWAISAESQWREEYLWLDRAEASQFMMRSDDPAVVHCDSRPRRDPVAPAPWHHLGGM